MEEIPRPFRTGLRARWRFRFLLLALSFANACAKQVDGPVLGIDLGTTFSCAGVYRDGQVEIIPNELGNRVTPSVVSFVTADDVLVGTPAKDQLVTNPDRTIYDVKRLIGRTFRPSDVVGKNTPLLSYTVDYGAGGAKISVGQDPKQFEPEQISAMILGRLKTNAETYLGSEVKHAVVTVPASFNNDQRQATKDAATIAGLNVVQILSEPSAAAMAYGLDQQGQKTILIFDIGGGTCDVSIVKVTGKEFQVLGTSGDTRLGGEDFDRNIVDYLMTVFEKKNGVDLKDNRIAIGKMMQEAEKVKRLLSNSPKARFTIANLHETTGLSGTLSRARFEELNGDLFSRLTGLLNEARTRAGLKKDDINDIVLVGGSSRIPKVQQLVSEYFDGRDFIRGVNPDEAVASGAAILASSFSSGSSVQATLMDVTPLSLGVQTVGGVMTVVIEKNTPIPARNSTILTTHRTNQPALDVRVFEGERLLTKNNHFLGKFRLHGIQPAPRGTSQVEVMFDVDANGLITVSAQDLASGANHTLLVTEKSRRLTAEDISRMIAEAETFREEDEEAKKIAEAKMLLDSLIIDAEASFADGSEIQPGVEPNDVRVAAMDCRDWLASHVDATESDIIRKHAELENVLGGSTHSEHGSQHAGVGADDMEGHDEL